MLAFILIVTGVFIYNLRQPGTAKKKPKKKDLEEREGGGEKVMSGLRRALLESQTYEMSDEEKSGKASSPPPPAASKPKGLVSRLASKLISKLPSPPTPADQSALASSSRRHMRTFEDLAEEDKHGDDDGGFFGASKQGLIRDRTSSSGSERAYGSVERPELGKRTSSSRSSSTPPHQ